MSRLDNLYTLYRRYCKEIVPTLQYAVVSPLILYEDGSGEIEVNYYLGTDDNPFRTKRYKAIVFSSISDGVNKIKKVLDEQKTDTES